MTHSSTNSPIDAVITWVDGNDPVHQAKRMAALKEKPGKGDIPIAAGRDATRFQDNGELRYCIASIRKFAPWIRTIFIITDNQAPDFLTEKVMQEQNIKIIDHKVIFRGYEWALPTFNSQSIETAMWRIPDVAQKFIYFNDDFLITKKVDPEDFFQQNKVILRGSWHTQKKYSLPMIYANILANYVAKKMLGITRTMHLLFQMRGARLAGFSKKYFRSSHVPHPMTTATIKSYFKNNQEQFVENIKFQFRDMNQFWPVALANHLEIQNQNAVLKDADQVRMISGERDSMNKIRQTLEEIKSGKIKFLCLGSMEKIDKKIRNEIDETICLMLDM